jgi:hypothetical protein
MQFKQPEILFALLLIIIPIIVHLFHLQRFVKVPFTNVKFLKKIEQQTRKSSKLKKWLILIFRILAFACIILAFAQPYFSDQQKNSDIQTIIYLDNSLSMSYQKDGQEILQKSIQELIENLEINRKLTLLTNDNIFIDLDPSSIKNTLLNLKYSSTIANFESIFLKLNKQKEHYKNTLIEFIFISDFHIIKYLKKENITNINTSISLINVSPKQFNNTFIDSIYLSKRNNDQILLKVIINNTNTTNTNTSISLLNNDILIGKTTTPLISNQISEVEFSIPSQETFKGKLILEDRNLQFDNTLFFNLEKPIKTNILSIGDSAPFLAKIYTKDAFNFEFKKITQINFNEFENQHVIILNEIDKISNSLKRALVDFQKNGGNIVIIPPLKIDLSSYNVFFNELNIGKIDTINEQELAISKVIYEHPLLVGVFEKKVTNFEYPVVKSYYPTAFKNVSSIVKYQNNQTFVGQVNSSKGSIFWFSSSLSAENSNFQNSPLIVPVFYNIALNSHKYSELYYTISKRNKIEVGTKLNSDHILKIKNESEELIPMQQIFKNKVEITTFNEPSIPGHYDVNYKEQPLKKVSFNYSRDLSFLKYIDLHELFDNQKNINISNSIAQRMNQLKEQQKINLLFRWFLGLAVLFLLLEIAILKFFKT